MSSFRVLLKDSSSHMGPIYPNNSLSGGLALDFTSVMNFFASTPEATTPASVKSNTTTVNTSRQARKRRILVVDDEKNIRLTIQHSLLAADYEVETAADGNEGLDKFRDGHYDLILMDLRMPQMNGIEMLREIREHDKHTAAVVITAYLTIDTLLEAFSLGVSDYIRKPFSPNDVREMVRRVLARDALDTRDPNAHPASELEYARKALAEQDMTHALEFAKHAVEHDSNNPDSQAFLGILEHLAGDEPAAERAFHEALLLDPQHQLSRDYLFWIQSKGRS
jgi:CheY-like chemotaxis protein